VMRVKFRESIKRGFRESICSGYHLSGPCARRDRR
jgi:hypothetical protein